MAQEWKFKPGKVLPEARLEYLQQDIPYEKIVEYISNDLEAKRHRVQYRPELVTSTANRYRPKSARGTAKGNRAIFCFPVEKQTLDLFFNGLHGYRAQYYDSPELGSEKNTFLLDQIKPLLLKIAGLSNEEGMTDEEVKKSLDFPSAKVWIVQRRSSLRKNIPPQIEENKKLPNPAEILMLDIPCWEEAMDKAYQVWHEGLQLCWSKKRKALFGVQAPIGTYLEVKGAWIYEGKEFVTEDKKCRAEQIHYYGFS